MIEEHIKEELSNNYIGALASCNGFILSKPGYDYGVDFILSGVSIRTEPNGHTRRLKNGKDIDIQMKSTTMASVSEIAGVINYGLEAKTYNDLIERNSSADDDKIRGGIPMILVLFVLPEDRSRWVEVDNMSLIVRHSAYWYMPESGSLPTANTSRIQIRIPKKNRFEVGTWPILYSKFYP